MPEDDPAPDQLAADDDCVIEGVEPPTAAELAAAREEADRGDG